jgi:hypothetical protein
MARISKSDYGRIDQLEKGERLALMRSLGLYATISPSEYPTEKVALLMAGVASTNGAYTPLEQL